MNLYYAKFKTGSKIFYADSLRNAIDIAMEYAIKHCMNLISVE